MSPKDQIQEYLDQAHDAEAQAAKTLDHHLRESWLRIAKSYRAMAQQRLDAAGGFPKHQEPVPGAKSAPQDDSRS